MIKLKNVKMIYPVPKRYRECFLHPFKKKRGVTALSKVNLHIETGDSICFLGPNGAGKTTVLKLIGGLLYPTSGSITINGFDTTNHNLEARKSVGFVLNEDRSFYWRLTGIQNLGFFGTLDNLSGTKLKKRVSDVLRIVELDGAADRLVSQYSSGMKQRLAIARGLLTDPDILILDEPTRTLDPLATERLRELIHEEIHKSKEKTLLIATHQICEAEMLCDKICIILRGRIKAFKDIKEIKSEYGDLTTFYKHMAERKKKP